MVDDLMVYLKTTDTCQLHCDHCFTNGKNGKKGFFNPEKTINFFERFKEYRPHLRTGNISFHGGEPMLAPPELMFEVWNGTKHLWPTVWWSVQTNLTYKLDEKKVDVFDKICQKSWGTSWDYNIRWPKKVTEDLWRNNVKELTKAGHNITVMVSLTGNLIRNKEPIEIIDDMASLGIQHINFERVTLNGNARLNEVNGLIPTNRELDHWFLKMWDQSVQHKTYKYIDNMFFDSILSSMVYQTYSGCRCRQCEQKVLTINADGRVGGCPNSAVENTFGHIDDNIFELMNSEGRICNIQTEAIRHPVCATCDVYDICNGDCHQLGWEDETICAAPKSLMQLMKSKPDTELYHQFLNGFQGQE
jgi:radical SAM protein with 4Fe4S-binding SPASM domain